MNLRHRLGPCVYSALHVHTTLWELMLSSGERRVGRNDAVRLQAGLPFLKTYARLASEYRGRLQRPYQDYTSRVSPDPIAISLELATFLAVTCAI